MVNNKNFWDFLKLNNFLKNKKGLTLVEILVATVIGSITVATIYFSFGIFSSTYLGIVSKVQVSRDIRNALTLVTKDVRLAGYTSKIPTQSSGVTFSPFPTLPNKMIIEKNKGYSKNSNSYETSSNADLLEVIYDQDRNTRVKVSYAKSNDNFLMRRLVKCLNTNCLNSNEYEFTSQGFYNYIAIANTGLEAFKIRLFDSSGLELSSSQANQAHFIRVSVLYSSANNGEVHKTEQQQIFNVEDFTFSKTDRFFRDMASVLIYPRNIQPLK